ncbi:hypothetical protein DEO72_LG1g2888 [Vigna unguiculata]|uniref:Ulp1 protease family n=1 Tax=Vigna unguiculata TaxID=3917 RepID=A0A4D6KVE9_VIGUN|nr:hypothetical protein DEO72_LG1g2888 [Vigna unguiculata]
MAREKGESEGAGKRVRNRALERERERGSKWWSSEVCASEIVSSASILPSTVEDTYSIPIDFPIIHTVAFADFAATFRRRRQRFCPPYRCIGFSRGRYDCGIIVLQMMELWDGHKKFDGNTMPNYTNEQLQQIRQQYIWHWILDVDNIHRHAILQYYDALLKS